MKKAAIVTQFYDSYNYGGVLQAYALQNCLRGMGCENEVALVEYRQGRGVEGFQSRAQQKKKQGAKASPLAAIRWELYRKLRDAFLARRKKGFIKFKDTYVTSSDEVYTDANIAGANDRYDCFIAGSDQVWNPRFSCDNTFLKFVKDEHRKISYAASIGVDSVSEEYLRYMVPLIDRLDAVSVREPSGVKILEGHVDKKVYCVLDPTLLLSREEWEKLCRPGGKDGGYIFVYLLGDSKQTYDMIQTVANRMHMRVISVPFGDLELRRSVLALHSKWALSASPADFLTLLHDASYVITDSFHGTVFSLIFHKRFCAVERKTGSSNSPMNVRLYDLLEMAGLEERLQCDADGTVEVLQKEIDFEPVDARLAEKIEYSKGFLRRALELEGQQ